MRYTGTLLYRQYFYFVMDSTHILEDSSRHETDMFVYFLSDSWLMDITAGKDLLALFDKKN